MPGIEPITSLTLGAVISACHGSVDRLASPPVVTTGAERVPEIETIRCA